MVDAIVMQISVCQLQSRSTGVTEGLEIRPKEPVTVKNVNRRISK